jgi:subtilase family serine protease
MNIRLHLARAALAATLLAALFSLSFKNDAAADSTGAPTAPAATVEQPSHVTLVSRLDQTKTLRVVVGLKLRNAADLDKLIHDQSNPSSPKFRQWITPTDFLEQFAPSPSAVDTVIHHGAERHQRGAQQSRRGEASPGRERSARLYPAGDRFHV